MNFDEAFTRLMGHEGGYSNNPADKGGATNWGVTEAVARQNGYTGDMKDLGQSFAKIIYRKLYWDAVSADQLPPDVRFAVFDAAVNSGVNRAIKWLQQALGIAEDGTIGSQTLSAARQAIGSITAVRIHGIRLLFMTNQPNWSTFGRGWAARIAKNMTEA